MISDTANPDIPALLALADRLDRIDDGLETFGGFLARRWASAFARARWRKAAGLDRWVDAWEALNRSFGRTSALHLDPRQTVLSAARTLEDTARRAGAL